MANVDLIVDILRVTAQALALTLLVIELVRVMRNRR